MAYYVQKDPDLLAADRIYKKIISSGRDTGRYSSPSPSCSVGRRSSHSKTWKSGNPSVKTGHSTPRGSSVLGEKHMNRHFPDTSEAAFKRTHDGAATQRSLSPTSTIRTGQSNKKRFVSSNQGSVKQSTGLAKKDKHLTGVPVEKKILDIVNSDRWNLSYQALRLEKEWTELDKRRDMKRNAEIVKHRVDNMYLMSGSGIRLKPKYDVNEIELQQLKELSNARQELRSKTRKNHLSSKGRQARKSGQGKNTPHDQTQPKIHINGEDPQKKGLTADNTSREDWVSDTGSQHKPHTPPDNQVVEADKTSDKGENKIDQNKNQNKESQEINENVKEGENLTNEKEPKDNVDAVENNETAAVEEDEGDVPNGDQSGEVERDVDWGQVLVQSNETVDEHPTDVVKGVDDVTKENEESADGNDVKHEMERQELKGDEEEKNENKPVKEETDS